MYSAAATACKHIIGKQEWKIKDNRKKAVWIVYIKDGGSIKIHSYGRLCNVKYLQIVSDIPGTQKKSTKLY